MRVKYQGDDALGALLSLLKSKLDGKADNKDNIVENKTLSTTWSNSKQSVTVAGVKADSIVDVMISPSATEAQLSEFLALQLKDGGQAENTITLECTGTVNTATIPILVVVRGNV